jgi:hypothetical protein
MVGKNGRQEQNDRFVNIKNTFTVLHAKMWALEFQTLKHFETFARTDPDLNKKLLQMLHGSRCYTGRFSRKESSWPAEASYS